MTMRSIRTLLALAAIFGFAAGSTMADDEYSFDVADGNWNVPGNWYPTNGPPGAGDTAIIQGDRHCHVTTYSVECKILQVVSGGILSLEAPCMLRLGDPYVETISSIGGGQLRFLNDTVDAYPLLTIDQGGVELRAANGGGTLTASEADDCGPGQGRIGTCCASTQVLTVSADVTVKGDLLIFVHVENNGGFVVDHANDEMIFNQYVYPRPKISGTGSFDVSAGTLTFDDCQLEADNTTTWNLSDAGTIHVKRDCRCGASIPFYTSCAIDITGGELWVERGDPIRPVFKTVGEFKMSGGTLDVDGNFKVTGGAELSGATIEVAPHKSATFEHD